MGPIYQRKNNPTRTLLGTLLTAIITVNASRVINMICVRKKKVFSLYR